MALMEINMLPLGTRTAGVSKYQATAIKMLDDMGLKYEVCPMCTVVEADTATLLDVARHMHEAMFADDVKRVITTIKIDDRKDIITSMERSVKTVKEKVKYKK
jgi:uncharacterized protein (TIGR00106 family)